VWPSTQLFFAAIESTYEGSVVTAFRARPTRQPRHSRLAPAHWPPSTRPFESACAGPSFAAHGESQRVSRLLASTAAFSQPSESTYEKGPFAHSLPAQPSGPTDGSKPSTRPSNQPSAGPSSAHGSANESDVCVAKHACLLRSHRVNLRRVPFVPAFPRSLAVTTSQPSAQPSGQPSTRPSNQLVRGPSFAAPRECPTIQPSWCGQATQPSSQPRVKPRRVRRPAFRAASGQPRLQRLHSPVPTEYSAFGIQPSCGTILRAHGVQRVSRLGQSTQPLRSHRSQPTKGPSSTASAQPSGQPTSRRLHSPVANEYAAFESACAGPFFAAHGSANESAVLCGSHAAFFRSHRVNLEGFRRHSLRAACGQPTFTSRLHKPVANRVRGLRIQPSAGPIFASPRSANESASVWPSTQPSSQPSRFQPTKGSGRHSLRGSLAVNERQQPLHSPVAKPSTRPSNQP